MHVSNPSCKRQCTHMRVSILICTLICFPLNVLDASIVWPLFDSQPTAAKKGPPSLVSMSLSSTAQGKSSSEFWIKATPKVVLCPCYCLFSTLSLFSLWSLARASLYTSSNFGNLENNESSFIALSLKWLNFVRFEFATSMKPEKSIFSCFFYSFGLAKSMGLFSTLL